MKRRPDFEVPPRLSADEAEKLLRDSLIQHRLNKDIYSSRNGITIALRNFEPTEGMAILRRALPEYHTTVNGAPRQFTVKPKPYHLREPVTANELLTSEGFQDWLRYYLQEYIGDDRYLWEYTTEEDIECIQRVFSERMHRNPDNGTVQVLHGIVAEYFLRKASELMAARVNQQPQQRLRIREPQDDTLGNPTDTDLQTYGAYHLRSDRLGTGIWRDDIVRGYPIGEIDQLLEVSNATRSKLYILEVTTSARITDSKRSKRTQFASVLDARSRQQEMETFNVIMVHDRLAKRMTETHFRENNRDMYVPLRHNVFRFARRIRDVLE